MSRLTLGEIADKSGGFIQTGPFGSQLHSYDYVDAGIPVVMPQDIVSNRIDLSKISYIESSLANTLKRHYLRNGDIVFPRRGDISKCAIFDDESRLMLCGTGCLKISIPEKLVTPKWLFYYLLQDEIIKYIENNAVGSTMLNLNTGILKSVEIEFPEIEVQKKIASTLSHYDDLIQTNQQRITLLEQASQRLYDEWFVKLRFPNYEQVLVVDGIPEGWGNGTVGDFYETSSGGTPSRGNPDYYTGEICWVRTQELQGNFIFGTAEKITKAAVANSSTKLFPRNTVLVAMYGVTIGELAILATEATTNQACCAILPKHECSSYIHAFLFFVFNKQGLLNIAQGSAQTNVSQNVIRAYPMIMPPLHIMTKFFGICEPLFQLKRELELQNQKLAHARDEILPRLMSGQLDVSKLTFAKVA